MDLPARLQKVYVPGRKGKFFGGHCFGLVTNILWDKSGEGEHEIVVTFNSGELETFERIDFDGCWRSRPEWWMLEIYNSEPPPFKYPPTLEFTNVTGPIMAIINGLSSEDIDRLEKYAIKLPHIQARAYLKETTGFDDKAISGWLDALAKKHPDSRYTISKQQRKVILPKRD